MSTKNPDYNERWEKISDYHHNRMEELRVKLSELHRNKRDLTTSNTQLTTQEWEEIDAEIEETKELKEKSTGILQDFLFYHQHETIQDFAQWYFNRHDDEKTDIPFDLEGFQSIQEVVAFTEENREFHPQQAYLYEQRGSRRNIKIAQPEGMDIFKLGDNNTIQSTIQQFSLRELCLQPYTVDPKENLATLVIIDQRDDEYHICLTERSQKQIKASHGHSTKNVLPEIATILYHELNEAKQRTEPKGNGLSKLLNSTIQIGHQIPPENVSFYMYTPEADKYTDARFTRYNMSFNNNRFVTPKVDQLESVPPLVHELYENHPTERHNEPYPVTETEQNIRDYFALAHSWNTLRDDHTRNVMHTIEDYLFLQEQRPSASYELRQSSVMRDVVSFFENYALNTAAAYIEHYGIDNADEKFKKTFKKEQESDTKEFLLYRAAINKHFGRMKTAKPRIGKILDLYKDIGYPVDEFETLEQQNKQDWKEQLPDPKMTSEEHWRKSQRETKPTLLVDYLKNIEEFILIRNAMEHDGGIHQKDSPESLSVSYKAGHAVSANDGDIARYVNATSLFMNHLKRALDYSLSDKDLTDTHRQDIPMTPSLKDAVEKDYSSPLTDTDRFDPAINSAIYYSPTIDELEIIEQHNGSSTFNIGEPGDHLLKQIVELHSNTYAQAPYTPYLNAPASNSEVVAPTYEAE